MELHFQYELVLGTTHWVAWFTEAQLETVKKEGWTVLHAYLDTGLIRNAEGRLVMAPESLL